jgi:hypothetical protein
VTTSRQIDANRRNASMSTGPCTEEGKRRSSKNALRHGLTAETVIEPLEDVEEYEAFEASIVRHYTPQSAVERELVFRLASIMWRVRRATAIETGLLQIRAEISREQRGDDHKQLRHPRDCRNAQAKSHGVAVANGPRMMVTCPQTSTTTPSIRRATSPGRSCASRTRMKARSSASRGTKP